MHSSGKGSQKALRGLKKAQQSAVLVDTKSHTRSTRETSAGCRTGITVKYAKSKVQTTVIMKMKRQRTVKRASCGEKLAGLPCTQGGWVGLKNV